MSERDCLITCFSILTLHVFYLLIPDLSNCYDRSSLSLKFFVRELVRQS